MAPTAPKIFIFIRVSPVFQEYSVSSPRDSMLILGMPSFCWIWCLMAL